MRMKSLGSDQITISSGKLKHKKRGDIIKKITTTKLNQSHTAGDLKNKKTNIPNLRCIRRSGLWGMFYPLIATEN